MAIKISFVDFWPGFRDDDNYFYNFLRKYFKVELSESPDYLFYSVYGDDHFNYPDSIKILYTGENLVPDFNQCDYALGFHFIDFEDRYLRFPLYLIYPTYDRINQKSNLNNKDLINRRFCNFVYSNNTNADPLRGRFFKELSKYKKVDSGGKLFNNIGHLVDNKLEFIKNYKFTIAFENSKTNGYTTEKLIEPMAVNSLPIYYGNPKVGLDFNAKSFVNILDFESVDEAIEKIIELDQNDDLYLSYLDQPWQTKHQEKYDWDAALFSFFDNIFTQPLPEAKRVAQYGFNKYFQEQNSYKNQLWYRREKYNKRKQKLKKLFGIAKL